MRPKRNFLIALLCAVGAGAVAGSLSRPPEPLSPMERAEAIRRANPGFIVWIELHDGREPEVLAAPVGARVCFTAED